MQYIAFDAHKHYTLASVERQAGGIVREERIPHERGALRQFLRRCDRGSPVAVETTGNWYWIVDEIEAAGYVPKLVHARKAKLMQGMVNKTDKLDARGLNRLQRTGTLPTAWIPPGEPASDGWSAARIEEEILVTETGHEFLTRFPAETLLVAGTRYWTATGPFRRRATSTRRQTAPARLAPAFGAHYSRTRVARPRLPLTRPSPPPGARGSNGPSPSPRERVGVRVALDPEPTSGILGKE